MIQVYVSLFWFCFLNFIPVDRAEISHMNRKQIRPGNRASPVDRAHMKRPLNISLQHCSIHRYLKVPSCGQLARD